MSTAPETSTGPEAEKVEGEVEKTIAEIEKQEVKVENASTPAEEQKEQSKLDKLIEKFDGLTERLGKIETRLAEPTVPAPEAKKEEAPVVDKSQVGDVKEAEGTAQPPRKRRLGAW